ncbi:U32 family peptidase [Hamadaea tsunoensis]|uniref:U32 family peptidase n=1 Tax=Hamadaea tsunoensis TaxID=53368 RepID=UPI00041A2175|nr:U32 family peptidase [Hamadaea tsunoensis]
MTGTLQIDVTRGASRARTWLRDNGLPYSDEIPLEASGIEFADGGHYGVEIPVVNNFRVLEATLGMLQAEGLPVTRFNETLGAMLLSDAEVLDMLALCRENGVGMVFALGPRPEYDRKAAFYRGGFGASQGRRINNNDALAQTAEEALRLTEMGCRGLIAYDLGVIRMLKEMRDAGVLPADLMIKSSSHCIVSNPMTAKVYKENGADSVTTMHDLGLAVLQDMRKAAPDLTIDLPTDVYGSKGGFIRFYEVPELVQICSPMMLKIGASAQSHPHDPVNENTIRQRVQRVGLCLEYLRKSGVEAEYISDKSPHRCVPVKV